MITVLLVPACVYSATRSAPRLDGLAGSTSCTHFDMCAGEPALPPPALERARTTVGVGAGAAAANGGVTVPLLRAGGSAPRIAHSASSNLKVSTLILLLHVLSSTVHNITMGSSIPVLFWYCVLYKYCIIIRTLLF